MSQITPISPSNLFVIIRLMLYCIMMQTAHSTWTSWARFLQRWGLDGWASAALDAGGPLTILAAQAAYLGQPFLGKAGSGDSFLSLVTLLEDHEQGKAFAAFLREEHHRDA